MQESSVPLVILTGMSGAGKSTALRTFEDLGFYCIDNLPPSLIETFIQLYRQASASIRGIAIVCDVRAGELFGHLAGVIAKLADDYSPQLIYFDCEHDVLVSRFNEARRLPPLGSGLRIEEALNLERQMLQPLKSLSAHVIDTSAMTSRQLRERLLGLFGAGTRAKSLSLTVLSFGFKFGLPMDADFVFDTRFLPNPYYSDSLRALTGEDPRVKEYVLGQPLAVEYLTAVHGLLQLTLPHYSEVQKNYAVVALGCTGGRHRSVVLANALAEMIEADGKRCVTQHRDIERD